MFAWWDGLPHSLFTTAVFGFNTLHMLNSKRIPLLLGPPERRSESVIVIHNTNANPHPTVCWPMNVPPYHENAAVTANCHRSHTYIMPNNSHMKYLQLLTVSKLVITNSINANIITNCINMYSSLLLCDSCPRQFTIWWCKWCFEVFLYRPSSDVPSSLRMHRQSG